LLQITKSVSVRDRSERSLVEHRSERLSLARAQAENSAISELLNLISGTEKRSAHVSVMFLKILFYKIVTVAMIYASSA